MNPAVSIPADRIADFCRANGIRKLAVFGSALRDDFGPESDIDLLVDFDPGRVLSLFDIVSIEQELSDLLGRKVDLVERVTVEQIRNYIRRMETFRFTETIYVA